MRDIAVVIDQLKTMTKDENFIKRMQKIKEAAWFTAPEVMYLRWNQLHAAMMESLGEDMKKWSDEDIELCSVFSTFSIEDIKADIALMEDK